MKSILVPIEDTPMYRARITPRQQVQRVKAFNPTTKLTRTGDQVRLVVEDVHEVVVLSY